MGRRHECVQADDDATEDRDQLGLVRRQFPDVLGQLVPLPLIAIPGRQRTIRCVALVHAAVVREALDPEIALVRRRDALELPWLLVPHAQQADAALLPLFAVPVT